MEQITSTSNQKVKEIAKLQQKKYREETGLFLVEGEKALSGLFQAGYKITSIFTNNEKKRYDISADKTYIVNDAVISKLSTTKSPCEIVAVARQKKYKINDFINMKKLVLLENIKDAGNLGTILRAGKAFGIDGILLLGDTIDLYNPKVVRASVGCFDIPVINVDYDDLNRLKNFHIYSTALYEDSVPLKSAKFKEPLIIAFGAEADGLTEKFLCKGTININIETTHQVESLNLASAVSICLYEIFIG